MLKRIYITKRIDPVRNINTIANQEKVRSDKKTFQLIKVEKETKGKDRRIPARTY